MQILGLFVHVISYRPTDLSLLKEFSKKSVLKIFTILFEQDCPEAVVHALYHKWDVKNGFACVLQFFSLISDSLGVVSIDDCLGLKMYI